MKQKSTLVAVVLGLAVVLAGCSSDGPTAPKPSPTPTALSIAPLDFSASSAEVKTAILITATVTQGGQKAPDNTSVTFTVSAPGVFADNSSTSLVRTTQNGIATATVVAFEEAVVQVTARVAGKSVTKNLSFFNPVNPRTLAIYGVMPDTGSADGGEQVTIYGRGFALPLAVTFDIEGTSRSAVLVRVNSAGTEAVVLTPKVQLDHVAGKHYISGIRVDAGLGTADAVSENASSIFTFIVPPDPPLPEDNPPPAIYQIVPSEGLDSGGEQVTIYGKNFYAPVTVKLGAEDAEPVSVAPDRASLVILTPKHSRAPGQPDPDVVAVRVKTLRNHLPGQEATYYEVTRDNGFSWRLATTEPGAPVLYSVNPIKGNVRGGEEVVLRGSDLCGLYDTVTKACIEAPEVIFSPAGFGDKSASVLSFAADGKQLRVITPMISATPVLTDVNANITVRNSKGSATLTDSFTFLSEAGDPQVLSVWPNKGSARGGDTVTIYGKYFIEPIQVAFSVGGLAQFVSVSADKTAIVVKTPVASIEPLAEDLLSNVTVRTQFGTGRDREFTLGNGFLFIADEPTPELFALSPNSGPIDGGTRVTITGQGFQSPVQVFFNTQDERQAVVVSSNFNQVICVAPSITPSQPSTPTVAEVKVRNITTGKTSNGLPYRYGEAMFMSAVSPNRGPADAETTVTIYGQGFVGPVEVVTVVGAERIQAAVQSVSGTEVIAKIQPLPADRRSCGIVTAGVEVTNITSNIKATGQNFYYESPTPLIASVEITAPSKTTTDNTVPQYIPGGVGSCASNPMWSTYTAHVHGANFQKMGADSAMVVSIPGVTAELPTTFVSSTEITFPLPDLTGVPMQEISCITDVGTCGLQYKDTPVALTVKNMRSECNDTLNGAIVIVPCDKSCRKVPAILAISADSAHPTVGEPMSVTVTLTSAPLAGTKVPVTLSFLGFDATPGAIMVPGGLGSSTYTFTVIPTSTGLSCTIVGETGTGTCTRVAQSSPPFIVRNPVTINTVSPLPGGVWHQAYVQLLGASGGAGGYTNWHLMSGSSLPADLTLSPGGLLSGTPQSYGTFTFTVGVSDSEGRTAEKEFTLTITPPPISLGSCPSVAGKVGVLYNVILSASGGIPPLTWSNIGALPAGLGLSTIAPGYGASISGTPTAAGTSTFTLRVQDSTLPTAQFQTMSCSITIEP